MKLHPVRTAAGFGGLLRATSRLGERPPRPPPPRGSSARRHVGSPKIAVLGAAGGYPILPVLLSALGLLRSDVRARETQPGRRWKGRGGPGSSSTPSKGHGDLLQKAAFAGGRAGDGQAAGHPVAWGAEAAPAGARACARLSCSLPGHPSSLQHRPAPPGTVRGVSRVLEPCVSRGFGDSAVAPRSLLSVAQRCSRAPGERRCRGGPPADLSFLRPESQPTTSDETVVAGGTVVLKCQVEDPDDSSLQWSNPAQQTLYFGEKRGARGEPGTGRGRRAEGGGAAGLKEEPGKEPGGPAPLPLAPLPLVPQPCETTGSSWRGPRRTS